jgi:hypothetical protein
VYMEINEKNKRRAEEPPKDPFIKTDFSGY